MPPAAGAAASLLVPPLTGWQALSTLTAGVAELANGYRQHNNPFPVGAPARSRQLWELQVDGVLGPEPDPDELTAVATVQNDRQLGAVADELAGWVAGTQLARGIRWGAGRIATRLGPLRPPGRGVQVLPSGQILHNQGLPGTPGWGSSPERVGQVTALERMLRASPGSGGAGRVGGTGGFPPRPPSGGLSAGSGRTLTLATAPVTTLPGSPPVPAALPAGAPVGLARGLLRPGDAGSGLLLPQPLRPSGLLLPPAAAPSPPDARPWVVPVGDPAPGRVGDPGPGDPGVYPTGGRPWTVPSPFRNPEVRPTGDGLLAFPPLAPWELGVLSPDPAWSSGHPGGRRRPWIGDRGPRTAEEWRQALETGRRLRPPLSAVSANVPWK